MPCPADRPSTAPAPCLRLQDIAPGRPYHAALHATEAAGARGYRVTEHSHDFYEMIFVAAGEAVHAVNGDPTEMRPGDLFLLRPGDRHSIRFHTGRILHYINIAVEAGLWRGFHDLASFGASPDAPVARNLGSAAEGAHGECAAAFRRALVRFRDPHGTPSPAEERAGACRLLATVAPWLFGAAHRDAGDAHLPDDAPPWLAAACRRLRQDPDALRAGLPALEAAAGVSYTHLARVLKAATGLTPTAYVNRLRLERAAVLLTTTALPILDIAGECGFEQAGYFYRLFRARFGTSPHAYRVAAARGVTPRSGPRGQA